MKSTTTSVTALGDVQALGQKLAESRSGQLLSSTATIKDGIEFYNIEIQGQDLHQLLMFCVWKGRLWKLEASAPEKRWPSVENIFRASFLSFMPRL